MTNKRRTDWPAQNSILRRTGGHAVRQETNIRTDRHTQKQTGRQTDRERGTQASERNTDMQLEKETRNLSLHKR